MNLWRSCKNIPDDVFTTQFNDSFYHVNKATDSFALAVNGEEYTNAEIWDMIAQSAWECADPGLVFY